MADPRKHHSAEMKAKVALEAIKGQKTANEIASEYGVHPTQIAQWKKQALDELPTVFARPGSGREKSEEVHTVFAQRQMIEPHHPQLSLVRQCDLLGLARSSYYYEPVQISEENLLLMRLLDEQYTRTPFLWKSKDDCLVAYSRIRCGSQEGEAAPPADGSRNDLSETALEPGRGADRALSLPVAQRHLYNYERLHQSLDYKTPFAVYMPDQHVVVL